MTACSYPPQTTDERKESMMVNGEDELDKRKEKKKGTANGEANPLLPLGGGFPFC